MIRGKEGKLRPDITAGSYEQPRRCFFKNVTAAAVNLCQYITSVTARCARQSEQVFRRTNHSSLPDLRGLLKLLKQENTVPDVRSLQVGVTTGRHHHRQTSPQPGGKKQADADAIAADCQGTLRYYHRHAVKSNWGYGIAAEVEST